MPDHVPRDLNSMIKELAKNAVKDGKPMELAYGLVESASPLTIKTSQKLPLEEEDLILTDMVRDHTVDITVSHETGKSGESNGVMSDFASHSHTYAGRKKIMLHYGLKAGERVLLLREQGGQKFLVIGRLSEISTEGEWL